MPEAVRLDFEKLIDYVKDNFSDKDKEKKLTFQLLLYRRPHEM